MLFSTFKLVIKKDAERYLKKKFSYIRLLKLFIFETGFFVTVIYRLQRYFLGKAVIGIVVIKILEVICRVLNSCYISYRAEIKEGLFLPHPTGIVIGENCVIGSNATIYQNVTIGQKKSKYPIVKDFCTLYPGCVLVGDVTIYEESVIGPNAVIIHDVLPHTTVVASASIQLTLDKEKK